MRYLLLAGAMVLISAVSTTAQASERLRVNDIHNFINNLNGAVNSINLSSGRSSLENMISNQATFEDNVNTHTYNQAHWVNNPYHYYHNAYRYPYHNGYTNVGYRSMNKWEQISKIETKKRTVPGYQGKFMLSNITISPLADSAVVDVDFKEQSVNYVPGYAPYYYNHVSMNTHSKCKMHLGKMDSTVYLTRMYCNTTTNLPL